MPVSYNGNKLIPAPLVTLEKNYIRTGQTKEIGTSFTIALRGYLTACKGSPRNDGSFWTSSGYPPDETTSDRFQVLLQKQDALRRLFAPQGKELLIESWYGDTPIRCYPIVDKIDIQEGLWTDYIQYSVSLSCPFVWGALDGESEDYALASGVAGFFVDNSGDYLPLLDASEDWQIDLNEGFDRQKENTYRLVHNVKAVGKLAYDGDGSLGDGWQQAKKWVDTKTGIDYAIVQTSGMLNLPAYYVGRNYNRVASLDELGGAYSVIESWILLSGYTLEEFNLSIRKGIDSNLNMIHAEGKIEGLEDRSTSYFDITQTKWSGVLQRFDELYTASYPYNKIYYDTLAYAGASWLNPEPLNSIIGRNPILGTITYSLEYNDRPARVIPSSLSEHISIQDNNPTQIIAKIPVLGRAAGPVLQDIGTVSERKRTLSVEVVMPIYSGLPVLATLTSGDMYTMINSSPKSSVDLIKLACYTALSGSYSQVYTEEDNETWNPFTGQYSRTVGWVYQ